MRLRVLPRVVVGVGLGLSMAGCPSEPPKPAVEPKAPADEWASIPSSPEWLHATRDVTGPHEAECAKALEWLKGESNCQGAICEHARDLGKEWLAKCPRLSSSTRDVQALVAQSAERAGASPTSCERELVVLLRDGCKKKGDACMEEGQGWATRCAHAEASPLAVRMLERTVERAYDEPTRVTLDPRSCDELRVDVATAATCNHRFKCEDALKLVEPYRERCQGESSWPTMATAVLELATFVGAQKPTEPIGVQLRPNVIAEGEVPLGLTDGSGAALWVCDTRPVDVAGYLEARRACQGGKVVFARGFKVKGRLEVHAGALDAPSDDVFRARFPGLVVHGEAAARDRAIAAELEPELKKAAALAEPEAVASMMKALSARAADLRRSAGLRAALAANDEVVVPLLRAVGKAKVAAGKARLSAVDRAGLAERAIGSPLGDVGVDGAVRAGVPGPLDGLDVASMWPKAAGEYLDAVKPLVRKPVRPAARELALVRTYAETQAQACGEAMRKARAAEQGLMACGFGFETCDEGKIAAVAKEGDDARAAAEDAHGKLRIAASALGAARADVLAAAKVAGCVDPWW
jgi:hypothetical protein